MLLDEKKRIKEIFKLIGASATLDEIKYLYAEFVLESLNWNRTHAAKSLKVPIKTFRQWYNLKEYIEIPEGKKWKKKNSG